MFTFVHARERELRGYCDFFLLKKLMYTEIIAAIKKQAAVNVSINEESID